ncbi:MAG: hypothetical protein AB7F89_14350 [Pirellulaceae bacterium]
MRALLLLIEQLAETAASSGGNFGLVESTRKNDRAKRSSWRTDRFKFESFKVAVVQLLSFVAPNAPMRSPWEQSAKANERMYAQFGITEMFSELKDDYSTPEKFGKRLFTSLLTQIHSRGELSDVNQATFETRAEPDDGIHDHQYEIVDASRDLGLLLNKSRRQK